MKKKFRANSWNWLKSWFCILKPKKNPFSIQLSLLINPYREFMFLFSKNNKCTEMYLLNSRRETWLQHSGSNIRSKRFQLADWRWCKTHQQLQRWQNASRSRQKTYLWWLYVFLPISTSYDVSIVEWPSKSKIAELPPVTTICAYS